MTDKGCEVETGEHAASRWETKTIKVTCSQCRASALQWLLIISPEWRWTWNCPVTSHPMATASLPNFHCYCTLSYFVTEVCLKNTHWRIRYTKDYIEVKCAQTLKGSVTRVPERSVKIKYSATSKMRVGKEKCCFSCLQDYWCSAHLERLLVFC